VSGRYQNTAATIAELVERVNERIEAEGLDLEIVTGAEIAMSRIVELPDEELEQLRIGEGPWLLAEPPFTRVAGGLEGIVERLHEQGHRVVLAHPERCPAFHRDPRLLDTLLRQGVLASVTAGALIGSFGEIPRRFALDLFAQGKVSNVASDAHDDDRRPPSIGPEITRAGFAPLTDWLTQAVPAAILEGAAEMPSRPREAPARASARRGFWRRRG
jgi:protein-tyrosine phosphatase